MRKIRIIEHVSLDGVIQSFGGPDEDRGGDYQHGGWAVPMADPAIGEAIVAAQGDHFDLLLGRHTYDIFTRYWPDSNHPMAAKLNAARKYVATHRPDSLKWGPVQDLGADISKSIGTIKSSEGPDLIVWGSSALIPTLLREGLADELVLIVFPVMLGMGKRFSSNEVDPRELSLISTKATSTGVLINKYDYVGPLRTGSFSDPQ
jgi:dihydrofolate reductase